MNCNRYLQIRIDISESSFLRRRNYLVSERVYHTTKFFTELLLAIDMKKKQKKTGILLNKPVYLGYSILKLSNILMYEF